VLLVFSIYSLLEILRDASFSSMVVAEQSVPKCYANQSMIAGVEMFKLLIKLW